MLKVTAIYFSATETTSRCVDEVAQCLNPQSYTSINLADNFDTQLPELTDTDVVIVASPVYGGRLPIQVSDALKGLNGNNSRAIALVVYGNRDYDDALLELTDILQANSFKIIGQGAFIGQHSIFPKVGASRPDEDDLLQLRDFGNQCRLLIEANPTIVSIEVPKGKRPYKKIAGVPVHPKAKETDCKKCGTCASKCPVGAIPTDRPFTTDNQVCISCGRCISLCPHKARCYSGTAYNTIGAIFKAGFSKRKNPEWEVAKSL